MEPLAISDWPTANFSQQLTFLDGGAHFLYSDFRGFKTQHRWSLIPATYIHLMIIGVPCQEEKKQRRCCE
jgi:hypothetical protein